MQYLAAVGRAHRVSLDPRLPSSWASILGALARLGVAPEACLFRSSEGYNAGVVEAHGTDRWGRCDPAFVSTWSRLGLRGPIRPFARALYASTAAEIERQLAGGGGDTALTKCPDTPDPGMIVYRRRALARVGPKVYVFRQGDPDAPRRALVLWVPLTDFAGPPP